MSPPGLYVKGDNTEGTDDASAGDKCRRKRGIPVHARQKDEGASGAEQAKYINEAAPQAVRLGRTG